MSLTISLRVPGGKKSELLGSTSLFSISMGIDKILMQGTCLRKTIDVINTTLKKCDIVISDALQRFNLISLYPDLSEKDALKMALDIGDNWLENNRSILSEFTIPCHLFRWDDWLNKKEYEYKKEFVNKLFQDDPNFRAAVEESIKFYIERKAKQSQLTDYNFYSHYNFSIAYKFVLEEASVMLLWCDVGYDFELHPSKRSSALLYLHSVYYKSNNNYNNAKLNQGRIKILGSGHEVF